MRGIFMFRLAAVAAALLTASLISISFVPESSPAAARSPDSEITVNRALKGDRLQLLAPTFRLNEAGSPGVAAQRQPPKKIPLGCDRAFSPISSPKLANVFGRCTA